MLPKSQKQVLVGYDNGLKSVKFYNAPSKTILTSQNYKMLTLTTPAPPEEVGIKPPKNEGENVSPSEGENGESTRKNVAAPQLLSKKINVRKRLADSDINPHEPRRTRGIKKDYRYLHYPFPDEEEAGIVGIDKEEAYIVVPNDDCHSLQQARGSTDWEDWEQAMDNELDQLHQMGMWKLVEKPPRGVPIANKWVYTKKRDKDRNIVKYKVCLVTKGCAQRPGHDYLETHSPVVQMESIRAILVIAATRKLYMHQMDVKGAYLNSTLKEKVYMKQPEGFDDRTGRI